MLNGASLGLIRSSPTSGTAEGEGGPEVGRCVFDRRRGVPNTDG